MQTTPTIPAAPKPAPSSARSVLFADDDAEIRSLVAMALEGTGFTLLEAESGEDCLEICRRGFRGIILMDICMGGINGWETIRVLSEEGLLEGSLVCMLTGSVLLQEGCAGIADVVFDYLPKPFGIPALQALLENASQCLA